MKGVERQGKLSLISDRRTPELSCVPLISRIFCKLHGEGRAVMRCPACDALLKFHHWLMTKTLVPYKRDADSA